MTYPHSDVIRAWLDGASLEWLPDGSEDWRPLPRASTCLHMPTFDARDSFRVAPVKLRYRLCVVGSSVVAVNNLREAQLVEGANGFKGYAGEWVDVEHAA